MQFVTPFSLLSNLAFAADSHDVGFDVPALSTSLSAPVLRGAEDGVDAVGVLLKRACTPRKYCRVVGPHRRGSITEYFIEGAFYSGRWTIMQLEFESLPPKNCQSVVVGRWASGMGPDPIIPLFSFMAGKPPVSSKYSHTYSTSDLREVWKLNVAVVVGFEECGP